MSGRFTDTIKVYTSVSVERELLQGHRRVYLPATEGVRQGKRRLWAARPGCRTGRVGSDARGSRAVGVGREALRCT